MMLVKFPILTLAKYFIFLITSHKMKSIQNLLFNISLVGFPNAQKTTTSMELCSRRE